MEMILDGIMMAALWWISENKRNGLRKIIYRRLRLWSIRIQTAQYQILVMHYMWNISYLLWNV